MKKILISLSFVLCGLMAMAQSTPYESAMKGFLTKMSSANTPEAYQAIANGFGRIASAEKTQWLPHYYAAFNYIMEAYTTADKSKVDAILDVAEKHLYEGNVINTNDEMMCLDAWCKSARISVDPMTRGMKYGMASAQLLEQAKKMNPANPRIYFLQGQSAFYTPEAFGGGKAKAKDLFAKAVTLYGEFKPSGELMPNWGAEKANEMLAECSK